MDLPVKNESREILDGEGSHWMRERQGGIIYGRSKEEPEVNV